MSTSTEAINERIQSGEPGIVGNMMLRQIGKTAAKLPEHFEGRSGAISLTGSNIEGQARVMVEGLINVGFKDQIKRLAVDFNPDEPAEVSFLEAKFLTFGKPQTRGIRPESLRQHVLGKPDNSLGLFSIVRFISMVEREASWLQPKNLAGNGRPDTQAVRAV
jgi:hypothetical protein